MLRLPKRGLPPAVVALAALASAPVAAAATPPSAASFRAATPDLGAPPRAVPAPEIDDEPILPANRVLAIYGAPQLGSTALGERSPRKAARLAVRQARPYERKSDRPVIPALDLIGVVANSTPGSDRRYRTRQPPELIDAYLAAARRAGARLMLDVQPARSPIVKEIAYLKPWLSQPDVDLAIDPEWNVGRHGVPGQTVGSVTARDLNAASRAIRRIVKRNDLPLRPI